jgi:hypothetical protein
LCIAAVETISNGDNAASGVGIHIADARVGEIAVSARRLPSCASGKTTEENFSLAQSIALKFGEHPPP